ncbi:MAG: 2-oxoglutarate oxidoreductase [Desulfobacterales bacterium]|nr:2-oxoglutarate oxidoreductase [Desulfobacterales bacterium]
MTEKKIKHESPALLAGMIQMHHCPGCHYGIILSCLTEALEETGTSKDVVIVTGIGCSMVSTVYIKTAEGFVALHGRAPAAATGIKRSLGKDKIVMTIQGDGDLSAIGMGEAMGAANRFERLTTIFLNNANFGTTGGQAAPTSMVGQITPTTPYGKDFNEMGFPVHMAELMSNLKGVVFSFRGAVNSLKNYNKTKKAMITAINKQKEDAGYSFVEVLSACPPGHHIKAQDSLALIDKMIEEFPLGEYKNTDRPS